MLQVVIGVGVFTGIVLTLSAIILLARSKLVATGMAEIVVNEDRRFQEPMGAKLLNALNHAGLYLPAGCGGKGTCGQCRVQVFEGGGPLLPTEFSAISRREAKANVRLACQVTVRENLRIDVPNEVLGVRRWACTVRTTRGVAPLIRELVFELPKDEDLAFKAGGYVLVECPPYQAVFKDFVIEPEFRDHWDRHDLWKLKIETTEETTRAYSMANYPDEKGIIMLDVRVALPPSGSQGIPPGVVSSYLFSLKPGDPINITGPYGEFYAKDTDKEMVFIGGGAGMAPLRSHIFDQLLRLRSDRRISFWYGARSERDVFYTEDFDRLATEHKNFTWAAALSEPGPDSKWTGPTGFIHQVVYDQHLKNHPAPEDNEYYLCGPPLMIAAAKQMLEDLGVDAENILADDFGS